MKTLHISNELYEKIKQAQSQINKLDFDYSLLSDIVKQLDVNEYQNYIDKRYLNECYCEELVNKAECF
jgi:hypothetical protein